VKIKRVARSKTGEVANVREVLAHKVNESVQQVRDVPVNVVGEKGKEVEVTLGEAAVIGGGGKRPGGTQERLCSS
jgi:hypothetical protein